MFICSLQLCGIVREKRSNILEKVSRAEIKAGKKTVFYNCSIENGVYQKIRRIFVLILIESQYFINIKYLSHEQR